MAFSALDFHLLDDLLFAADRGRLPDSDAFALGLDSLGPLTELFQAAQDQIALVPFLISGRHTGRLRGLRDAYVSGRKHWIDSAGCSGFLRLKVGQGETAPSRFCIAAHRAALNAGFASTGVRQLVAALLEMHGNILEHSEAIGTGVLAFSVGDGHFEFSASDRGAGVLSTLRQNPAYADVDNHAVALRFALTNGVSRFPDPDRGQGFRPLFLGLAGMNGELRFRSGDHALVLSGSNLVLDNHQTLQRVNTNGFLASVSSRR